MTHALADFRRRYSVCEPARHGRTYSQYISPFEQNEYDLQTARQEQSVHCPHHASRDQAAENSVGGDDCVLLLYTPAAVNPSPVCRRYVYTYILHLIYSWRALPLGHGLLKGQSTPSTFMPLRRRQPNGHPDVRWSIRQYGSVLCGGDDALTTTWSHEKRKQSKRVIL
ncbi:hypothetical protein MRX96_013695 [Rhipicephalus microplus]